MADGRDVVRLGRGDRDRRPRAAWCSSACGSRSSTCTSRAASARRAARGRAGWCSCSSEIEDGDADAGATSTCCSTSATGSSASACARSATAAAMPVASYVDKFRDEFQAHIDAGRLPVRRRVVARGRLRAGRPRTTHATCTPVGTRGATCVSDARARHRHVDGREVQVPKGTRARRGRARGRDRDPGLLLRAAPRAARRRLPHVPRRDRGDAEAPGRLHDDRAGRDGRAAPRRPRRRRPRARRRRSSSSSSTTRSTARSATRAASARCRT